MEWVQHGLLADMDGGAWLILLIFGFGIAWTIFLVLCRPDIYWKWEEQKEQKRRDRWNRAGKAAAWWFLHK